MNFDPNDCHCQICHDQNYITQGCCSGKLCGCRGEEVTITNCHVCNPNNDKPKGDMLVDYAEELEFVPNKRNK